MGASPHLNVSSRRMSFYHRVILRPHKSLSRTYNIVYFLLPYCAYNNISGVICSKLAAYESQVAHAPCRADRHYRNRNPFNILNRTALMRSINSIIIF